RTPLLKPLKMPELPEEFLRGIKLFNEGRFFECHEAWEAVWLKAGGVERDFLHAIIQAAAALHHFQRGNLKGARSVGRRAIGKLAAMPAVVMRLDTGELRSSLESILAQTDAPIPHIKLQGEDQ
ncbi:MAG: DUF309 domain-containing protein, partial [Blastocatellia bacterium]